ncbi:UNKNOWN [Stylonychia lemnae]|uniref:Uncharacterized protein n=1 Tax=Stylonychia lemnae TaxID=5949 RepID=A0A078BAQ8_STYLE|nr:UNKNOWN [Stylonychia lemnae]|eukprot:CDW90653.1 UNKNOWN [Stylonychia lemnae]
MLSEQDRRAYESYILASSDEDRQEAIKKLIPGSHLHYHLYFVDRMKTVGSKLSEEDQTMFEQFRNKYQHETLFKQIEIRLKLLEYDDAADEEQRKKVVQDLASAKFLSLYFNFQKPDDIQRHEGESSSSQAAEESHQDDEESAGEASEPEDKSYGSEVGDEEVEQESNQRNQNNIDVDLDLDSYGDEINAAPEQFIDVAFPRNRAARTRNQIDNRVQQERRTRTKKNEFDYERHFGKEKIKKMFKANKLKQKDSSEKLRNLPEGWEHKLDFTQYHHKSVAFWAFCNSSRISDIQNDSFFESLKAFFNERYEQKKTFLLDHNFLRFGLTLQQLDRLGALHPKIKEDKHFIGSYFQKQFHDELSSENQEAMSNDEKRANLLQLYNYTKSKNMPQSLQSQLLSDALDLGIKLNIYDEDLFRDYLKIPTNVQANVFKEKKKAVFDDVWNTYLFNVQSQNSREGKQSTQQSQFINKYLEHFCQEKGSLESFKDEFDIKFLKTIEERIKIYNSNDMTDLKVDLKKYQSIASEVVIRFVESNKETFAVEEEVNLSVELKNVQTLYVKIFEFNTETYYKKTLQPFNSGVNLDGLIASIEKQCEYSHSPNKKFVESFAFPELTGKIGLFIVEFIGNGMSCRAVIKKGSLSLIHKPTVAGHMVYILDEKKQICNGPKTGIYFDGQYFKANEEQGGKIFISYGKSALESKAIVMNNDFAQLCDFQRETEQYEFNAWMHLCKESVLIGNKAQIIIRPTLLINGRQAPLKILKNTKIVLTTQNYIDNIPTTKNFDGMTFTENKELVIDFQVPAYLSTISVQITTELYNVTLQQNQSFSAAETFTIQTHQYDKNMIDAYLRKENGEYFIYVLGKNGEPKPKVSVNLMMMSLVLMKRGERNFTLITDANGVIKLGHLKKIMLIEMSISAYGITKMIFINNLTQNLTYPSRVDTVEGEDLEFPVLFKKKARKNFSLLKRSECTSILEDYFDKTEFISQNGEKDYNLIKLKNLPDGQYVLNLKDIKKDILILVHKGQYWDDDNFILKRNCIFENEGSQKPVKIAKVLVEEGNNDKSNITVKLEDHTDDARVHIIAQQFENSIPHLPSQYDKLQSKTVFPFAQWKNIFMSNRELSDEFRYVFDRKFAQRYQGNTLERPRLVLKRAFIQATQIDQAQMKQGTQFEQIKEQPKLMVQNIAPRAYKMKQLKPMNQSAQIDSIRNRRSSIQQDNYDDEDDEAEEDEDESYYNELYGSDQEMNFNKLLEGLNELKQEEGKISEFQNFLKNGALTDFNLKPDSNGEIKISRNLLPFTQLHILVIDKNSVAQKQLDLALNQIQKRDLSLNQPLDTSKGYTESRATLSIMKDETHFIEDITSTEIQLIDSIQKVKGVYEVLMKQFGTQNQDPYKELLPIFIGWPKYSLEDKNKQFNKLFCHELNLFIYFRDQAYFNSIVKPYLSNKMEKTFVDFYLLGQYNKITNYQSINQLAKLNSLERCLLVDTLIKVGQKEQAIKLAKHLEEKNAAEEYVDQIQKDNHFDTVLNMNMLKSGESDLGSLSTTSNNLLYATSSFSMPPPPPGGPPLMAMTRSAAPQMAMMRNQISFQNECLHDDINFEEDEAYDLQMEQERKYDKKEVAQKRSRKVMDKMDDDILQERESKIRSNKLAFQEVQQTSEYMETHYYNQKSLAESKQYMTMNLFWADYANYLANRVDESKPFLTANFIRCIKDCRSALISLAILGLAFEDATHTYKTNEGRGLEITANSHIILFKKEVREAPLELSNDILVTHRYVLSAEIGFNTGTMPEEFLTNKAYSCEVIMTNVSPLQKNFSLLYQIPQGSLPLEMTKYMKSIPQNLASYTTTKLFFHFYFPKEGSFVHFPSNISQEGKIIARADTNTLRVVDFLSVKKKETFKDIVQTGTKEDILEFLKTKNLIKCENGFSWNYLTWMLKDKPFYEKVIQIIRDRYIYNRDVWSFAFYHCSNEEIMREFILTDNSYQISAYVGSYFRSKLFDRDPEENDLKHLDYYPMLNARAHIVGDIQQWSLNRNLKETYSQFLQTSILLPGLGVQEKMILIYNLQLQDRINEAIKLFETIDMDKESQEGGLGETLRIQYDYLRAYFDFFNGESESFKVARTIVRKYEDYPVASWRILFLEILDQLNEYDGEEEEPIEVDAENQTEELKRQKYKQQINKEPRIEVEVNSSSQQIQIDVANFKALAIKFYIIDAEILFSRTPFLKENTEEFSYVKPCHVIERDLNNVDLNSSIDTVTYLQRPQKFEVDIPYHLKHQNMVIEISGEGKQIFRTYYPTQIKVNILESYGELKVTDNNGAALSKVYVKVFYQPSNNLTGQPKFFKDGYTDIRGKFEYAQSSGSKLSEVKKFAIFVMSDTLGSIIKECDPPKQDPNSGTAGGIEINQLNQRKQERILSKVAYSKANYSKKK